MPPFFLAPCRAVSRAADPLVRSAPYLGLVGSEPRNTVHLASAQMKSLGLLLVVVAFSASAAEPLPSPAIAAPASVPAALYSFIDVYRLTVGRAPVGLPLTEENPEAPIRVAVLE